MASFYPVAAFLMCFYIKWKTKPRKKKHFLEVCIYYGIRFAQNYKAKKLWREAICVVSFTAEHYCGCWILDGFPTCWITLNSLPFVCLMSKLLQCQRARFTNFSLYKYNVYAPSPFFAPLILTFSLQRKQSLEMKRIKRIWYFICLFIKSAISCKASIISIVTRILIRRPRDLGSTSNTDKISFSFPLCKYRRWDSCSPLLSGY